MSVQAMTWAFEQQLPPAQKLVLLSLANHANREGTDCYPGQDTIADEASLSARSVRRHVKALEEAGLITRQPRMRDDGRGRTSDSYTLHMGHRHHGDQAANGDRLNADDQPDSSVHQDPDDQPDNLAGRSHTTNRTTEVGPTGQDVQDQPDTGVRGTISRTVREHSRSLRSRENARATDSDVVDLDAETIAARELIKELEQHVVDHHGHVDPPTKGDVGAAITLRATHGADAVHHAIRWVYGGSERGAWWRQHITSMRKLKEHWDVMSRQAALERRQRGSSPDDLRSLADELREQGL